MERYGGRKGRGIDQRKLPHLLEIVTLDNLEQSVVAIRDMYVRGAPLIGVTAAFGFAISMEKNCSTKPLMTPIPVLLPLDPLQ